MVYNLGPNKTSKITQNRDLPKELKSYRTKELKAIAKIRGIKSYKTMSEDVLLGALTLSKPVKKEKNQKQIFLKQE